MQKTKQCAGCGAQMGARSRVCPRCGRGSLFGLLGQLFVLGVLLLAIGIVSGLIPLASIQRAVMGPPADTVGVVPPARPSVPKTAVRRPRTPRREVRGTESVAVAAAADSQSTRDAVARVVMSAPCPGPDTEMIRRELQQPGPVDEALLAARACVHDAVRLSDTAPASMPEPQPGQDTAAAWPADSPTAEPPAF